MEYFLKGAFIGEIYTSLVVSSGSFILLKMILE